MLGTATGITSGAIAVSKFGGSSLATPEHVRSVARRVAAEHATSRQQAVVVSAQGDTTDRLLRAAEHLCGSGTPAARREIDQLLATGETASAALLALCLQQLGVPAVSLSAALAGIRATGPAGAGVIREIDPVPVRRLAAAGQVAVVSGFQGVDEHCDVVTLGRGASDTTAVALAAALGSPTCDIFTDVDGIYTADPRSVADAVVLPWVHAWVMAEMAFAGARVMHARSVELAARHGIDVRVRNSRGTAAGSLISARGDINMLETDRAAVAAAGDPDVARVLVHGDRDVAADLLTAFGRNGVPVDLVARSGPHEEIFRMGFVLRRSDLPRARTALHEVLSDAGRCVRIDEDVAKVSLIGMGLLSRPEYAARMISVLGAAGISTRWISTSQIRISMIIAAHRLDEALNLVHAEFELGAVEASRLPA